jgi:hypothetical protein
MKFITLFVNDVTARHCKSEQYEHETTCMVKYSLESFIGQRCCVFVPAEY